MFHFFFYFSRVNVVGRGWVRAVSLCGATLAVACGDGDVLLYDFTAHARVSRFSFDSAGDSRASVPLNFVTRRIAEADAESAVEC